MGSRPQPEWLLTSDEGSSRWCRSNSSGSCCSSQQQPCPSSSFIQAWHLVGCRYFSESPRAATSLQGPFSLLPPAPLSELSPSQSFLGGREEVELRSRKAQVAMEVPARPVSVPVAPSPADAKSARDCACHVPRPQLRRHPPRFNLAAQSRHAARLTVAPSPTIEAACNKSWGNFVTAALSVHSSLRLPTAMIVRGRLGFF